MRQIKTDQIRFDPSHQFNQCSIRRAIFKNSLKNERNES